MMTQRYDGACGGNYIVCFDLLYLHGLFLCPIYIYIYMAKLFYMGSIFWSHTYCFAYVTFAGNRERMQ